MRAALRLPRRRCVWRHAAADAMSTGPAGQQPRGSGGGKRPRADDLFMGVHRDNINVPNALSIARIAACPFLAWAVATGHYAPALGGFLAAGFLDWIDGYLARKWDQKTVVGSMLDPLADKILVGTLAAGTAYAGILSPWFLGVTVGRDVVLLGGGFWFRAKTRPKGKDFFDSSDAFEVRPTQLSKANTAGQLGVLALALVEGAWGVVGAEPLGILQAVVATSTILSGAQYVAAYRKYMVLPPKSTFKSKHGGRRRKEE